MDENTPLLLNLEAPRLAPFLFYLKDPCRHDDPPPDGVQAARPGFRTQAVGTRPDKLTEWCDECSPGLWQRTRTTGRAARTPTRALPGLDQGLPIVVSTRRMRPRGWRRFKAGDIELIDQVTGADSRVARQAEAPERHQGSRVYTRLRRSDSMMQLHDTKMKPLVDVRQSAEGAQLRDGQAEAALTLVLDGWAQAPWPDLAGLAGLRLTTIRWSRRPATSQTRTRRRRSCRQAGSPNRLHARLLSRPQAPSTAEWPRSSSPSTWSRSRSR